MLKSLFSSEKKDVEKLKRIAEKVDSLKDKYSQLSDEELVLKTQSFKEAIRKGATISDIQVEAFAVVREAAKRVRNEFPY